MIRFSIAALGWLDCNIKINNDEIKISHSYDYGDKFQELINIIFIIKLEIESGGKETFGVHELTWCDDFIKYDWYLKINGEKGVDIKITKADVNDISNVIAMTEFSVSLDVLLSDLFISLKETLIRYGLIGYKNAWEIGNFPIAEFIELSTIYENHKLSFYSAYENDEGGIIRAKLEDEIRVLLSNQESHTR